MILSQTELIGSFNNINNYTKNVMGFNSQDVLIISQQDIPGSAPVDIFQESLLDPPSARGFFSLTFWGMIHFAAYSREDVHAASAGTVCIAQMGPAFVPVLSA